MTWWARLRNRRRASVTHEEAEAEIARLKAEFVARHEEFEARLLSIESNIDALQQARALRLREEQLRARR